MNHPRLCYPVSAEPSAELLLHARQLGCECVYAWVSAQQANTSFLRDLRLRVEDAGLCLHNVGCIEWGKNDKIHLGLPGRDEAIERFLEFVVALGQAGIHITTFTWEPTQVWSSEHGETRWARTRRVDLNEMVERPWTHGREYSEQEIWDSFGYFMKRMIPVAEDAGVRLALHPNDPPSPHKLGGIPCLIHSFDDYRRAFEIADSQALGMEFCTGCWLEGGPGFGDILQGLREFTEQDRILLVHFRNVSAPLPQFVETFLDNGYMDMYQIMRTLYAAGYSNTVTPDHVPQLAGEQSRGASMAYALGYMRALLQRAEAELS